MKQKQGTLIGIIVFFSLIILGNTLYRVDQTQEAVVVQFGRPIKVVHEPGLKVKKPFVQQIIFFEKRILEWDGRPTQIPTRDKKYIWVDTCARWKIIDPLKFLESVRDETCAHGRLDDMLEAAVRNYITDNLLLEVVRDSNRVMEISELEIRAGEEKKIRIEIGREKISRQILEEAAKLMPQYGIELIDVRIKRLNYVESVRERVYARMIAERNQIAAQYRSEGEGLKSEILGRKEKELKRIQSGAYKKAQEIKGKSDAQAVKIYAKAYGKDPEFYSFLKTLDTYKKTLNKNTWLILTTDSDYLKYLKKFSE